MRSHFEGGAVVFSFLPSLFLLQCLVIPQPVAAQEQTCPANMRALRLETDATNPTQHDADQPASFSVKIRVLKECRPVANAAVTFTGPASAVTPGAVFAGGFTSASVKSDDAGLAVSPPLTPNIFGGAWEIHASADLGAETANLSLAQRNVKKTAAAAAAKPKSNAWKYALGVLIPGAAVGAVCATGHCGGGKGTADACTQNPSACALTVGTPQFGPHK